jgi:hypothetical protein
MAERRYSRKSTSLLTLLFADYQIILSSTKDNMQKTAYHLNQIITARVLSISVQKTKLMALKGGKPDGGKIVIHNKIIEEVNFCNYTGNFISYEKDVDVDNKLNNHLKIKGIINNTFRPQTFQEKKNKIVIYTNPSRSFIR